MSAIKNGDKVSVHYRGTLDDGTEFDNSYDRGETLTFEVGVGQMIKGFDSGVVGMTVGETKTIKITADEAYGQRQPEAVQSIPKTSFPENFQFIIGQQVQGTGPNGENISAILISEEEETATLDFNHPLAGKDLNFSVELVEILND
ncbi:MAG: peptidylprolyl isomerase [Actinomycetota bacterium]|nr:peptidylprolyl isomerase [Actinomycetota bacterium]